MLKENDLYEFLPFPYSIIGVWANDTGQPTNINDHLLRTYSYSTPICT